MDMFFEDFVKIIDNAVNSGARKVILTGWGEPTINPNILDMLMYAKSRNLYTVLNTNGITLANFVDELIDIGIDELYVSIDSIDVDLYEKIRSPGDISVVTRNIRRIVELRNLRRASKPIIKAIFTINKLNIDQLIKILHYSVDLGIQEIYINLYIHHRAGLHGMECIMDAECIERLKKIRNELSIKLINTPIKVWMPNLESLTSRECPFALNKALYVRVDGKVTPCMFLAYNWAVIIEGINRVVKENVIGDALKESLINVWRRNIQTYFKLSFNYMPSCLDCELRNWCSYTLTTEVDCWGNAPNCAFCPYHYKFSYCPT